MFLEMLQKRNPKLINAIFALHQSNQITPDTIVLDLQAIQSNATAIANAARSHHLRPFFITKQFGFNPLVAKAIISAGFEGVVCVDFREAQMCMQHNLPIANIGHLVQIPKAMLTQVIDYGAEFCTVYSIEKAQQINDIAHKLNKKQKILIKVIAENGMIYKGQEGGFFLDQLPKLIDALKCMPNLIISGLTAFPCWLYSQHTHTIEPTQNLELLTKAGDIFSQAGIQLSERNMPSANAIHSIPMIANAGGTHIEAGHSLTGTTPMHAYAHDLIEIPAMAYLSEISHHYKDKSYFYGGGYYRRYPIERALIGSQANHANLSSINVLEPTAIDYHFNANGHFPIGDTVIASFRTQVFVTRSEVIVLDQVQSGHPTIVGRFSALGDIR